MWTFLFACAEPDVAPTLTADDRPEPIVSAIGSELLGVPSGVFDMGCTPEQDLCDEDELDVHTVTLTAPYWVGRTEVTQAEFREVTGASPSAFPCDDCPVEFVTWNDAVRYANLLSDLEDLERCYSCGASTCEPASDILACEGYRLLTEAEWEWAARCGEPYRYAGSDEATDVAWFVDNAEEQTHPAASLAPNGCGLYDLSGNVYEYCNDWFEASYGPEDETDPIGPDSGPNRVIRGGGWHSDAVRTRVSNRYSHVPPEVTANIGFRVGRSAGP